MPSRLVIRLSYGQELDARRASRLVNQELKTAGLEGSNDADCEN